MLADFIRKPPNANSTEALKAFRTELLKTHISILCAPYDDKIYDEEQYDHASPVCYQEEFQDSGIVSVFSCILSIAKISTTELATQLAAMNLLDTWLMKAAKCSEQASICNALQNILDTEWETIFDFMLRRWDFARPLQITLQEVFRKTLTLQKVVLGPQISYGRYSVLLEKILKLDVGTKVAYYALELLWKTFGFKLLTEMEPNFFHARMYMMTDSTLASQLGKNLVHVMEESLQSLAQRPDAASHWVQLWQETIRTALYSDNPVYSGNVSTYILPGLFKSSRTGCLQFLRYVTTRTKAVPSAQDFQVLLHCLRKAKDTGVLEDIEFLANIGIYRETLSNLLKHKNGALRYSTLSLLVSSPKSTKQFNSMTYDLLRDTLSDLFLETDAQYRKEIVDAIRAFIRRFGLSLVSMKQQSKRAQEGQLGNQELVQYKERSEAFARWMIQMLKPQLEPGSGYQRVFVALQTIEILFQSGWNCDDKCDLSLGIVLFDRQMVRLVVDRLGDPFEDNRTLALKVLRLIKHPIPGFDTAAKVADLVNRASSLLQSTRGSRGDGGARAMQFVFERFVQTESQEACGLIRARQVQVPFVLQYLSQLLDDINQEISRGQEDLSRAAKDFPIHGRLTALRYMLESIQYKADSNIQVDKMWRKFHSRIISAAQRLWQVVQEVLCNDSPEGNLPLGSDEQTTSSLRGPETQVILSYCWRALREMTNVLVTMLVRAPFGHANSLLCDSDIRISGDLFLTWLTEIRHRGAFSAVSTNFVSFCTRIMSISHGDLKHLPAIWLQENLTLLKSPAHSKNVTRRSGGLPMSIVALLVSELTNDRQMLRNAMSELFNIAKAPVVDNDQKTELPQVHAMNTLKDIFIEAKLADRSIEFLEEAFDVSIDGFSSQTWAIRNCSIMLFNALLHRSFGARRPRSESFTKSLSAKTFFSRFPRVLRKLLAELEKGVGASLHNSASVTTGLYPVLTLLARLGVANVDQKDEIYCHFEKLVPLVDECCKSRLWQVRSMSAKALPTVLGDEGAVRMFAVAGATDCSPVHQNRFHGRLLQIDALLEHYSARDEQTRIDHDFVYGLKEAIATVWLHNFGMLVTDNKCPSSKALLLHIILKYWVKQANDATLSDCARLTQKAFDYCLHHHRFEGSSAKLLMIGNVQLDETVGEILLFGLEQKLNQKSAQDPPQEESDTIICRILANQSAAVLLHSLTILTTMFKDNNSLISPSVILSVYNFAISRDWLLTRTAARLCLNQMYSVGELPSRSDGKDASKRFQSYLSDIKSAAKSLPLVESTLGLLGATMAKVISSDLSDSEKVYYLQEFCKFLTEYGDEYMPLPLRNAILHAIQSSLFHRSIVNNSVQDAIMGIYNAIFDLLLDDDDDLREATAEFVCREILLLPSQFAPCVLRKLVISLATGTSKQSPSLQKLLQGRITGSHSARAQLDKALEPNGLLFAIEKQNLWRCPARECHVWLDGLRCMELDAELAKDMFAWSIDGLNALIESIRKEGHDGDLGWSSDPDVWEVGSRILLSNRLGISLASIEQRAAIKTTAKTFLYEAKLRNVHESWIQILES